MRDYNPLRDSAGQQHRTASSTSNKEQPGATSPAQPNKKNRTKKVIITMLLIVLCGATGGGVFLYSKTSNPSSPFPQSIVSQATFPLYYPEKLENNYVIDTTSLGYSAGTLLFVLRSGENTVTISEQKKPRYFDLNEFKDGRGMTTSRSLQVIGGQGIAGLVMGRQSYIIAKQDTIITIVCSAVPDEQLEKQLISLRRISQ